MNIDIKQNVKLLMVIAFIIIIGYFVLEQTNNMLDSIDSKRDNQEQNNTGAITWSWEMDTKEVSNKAKIEKLRNKLKTKWLIVKWDVYLENEQLALALRKYLEAYKENPNDNQILSKLWDTNFKMKKFTSAYNYYSKITKQNFINKEKMIQSLFYSKSLSSRSNLAYIKEELKNIKLSDEEIFYYENSLSCIEDFHLCKKTFNEYFENNDDIKDENLLSIKNAIENYRNFKLEEIYYKDALIVWSFFTSKLYPISVILWEKLLNTKKEYKPILKIVWKSHFELWDYKESKETLAKYYILDKEDAWVIYLIWILNSKLHEYVLSNIYLNKALIKWYDPSIDVQRKLIHNYYLLWNTHRLLSRFKLLLEREKAEKEDIQLAIYYHIINDDYEFAKKWSKKAIELFPEDEMFYWYLWWIYKEEDKLDKAMENLEKGLKINPRNSLLLLNMGYVEKMQWNTNKAFAYFKKTNSINKGWEFWDLAKEELELMKENKENNITN